MSKKILGLDLGTNSIGWALVNQDFENKKGSIEGLGSRIIPMSQDILGNFDAGQSHSQTADRTKFRGTRRLYQRNNLRRERLHRVMNILGLLPNHYANSIDFKDKLGQFKPNTEVKLNYCKNSNGEYEFIFKDSFYEMINEFKQKQPQLFYTKSNGAETKIPYDWTIYYLRKKALAHKITKEELAWLILNFNQKRGYYQLRGEEIEEDKNKQFVQLKVKELIDTGEEVKGKKLYDVIFENEWRYDRQIVKKEDWIGRTKEFIVTISTLKTGEIKYTYKAVNSEKDWIAIKTKTEQDIEKSGKTVGEYIYNTLLNNPTQKIRGKLVKTIERKFYKEEFKEILQKQIELQPELFTKEQYEACIEELYPKNIAHQNNIKELDFLYLFLDDIIFYQRPLKSQKSNIAGCQLEFRKYKRKNEETGIIELVKEPVKAISKSHPLFQEFRTWQWMQNLRIYNKVEINNGVMLDVTNKLLKNENDWVELFEFLQSKKEIEQKHIIKYFVDRKLIDKAQKDNYRWNYVEDKKYPFAETHTQFVSRLKKIKDIENPEQFLSEKTVVGNTENGKYISREEQLWHIIYSISDLKDFISALGKFANKHNIDKQGFVESFKKFPPFNSDYASYSQKALNKLLPLMRMGKYWSEDAIPIEVKERANSIMERVNAMNLKSEYTDKELKIALSKVCDDDIPKQLIKSFIPFIDKNPIKRLNTYQATYLIYGRHSEIGDIQRWNSPADIDIYLRKFKQHSLRNPIVEQVVTETLRVVRDIWSFYGKGKRDFFSEIHVELGREMKNPADKRKRISQQNTENENTNHRIKELLKELMDDNSIKGNVKTYSPNQQELLKIYEEGIFQNPDATYGKISEDEIIKIRKNSNPSPKDIQRYRLWLEQGYISPYTGEIIGLSELFTEKYQIEHIIPQSRYFDNSLSNKVICESEINPYPYKDNQTGYEFIKNMGGQIITQLSKNGNTVKLFTLEQYESHVNKYFKNNNQKRKNLLSEDIPEGFINRQMNDSRYISKLIKGLLSNIVREETEQEATSKHLLPVTGAVTSKLKHDWGLNDKWNEIIAPRFRRLNEITKTNNFGFWDNDINAFRIQVPDEISKGFNKKRIDHRHHALDALVIACTTRDHTHYLSALNAEKENYSLKNKLLIINKEGHFTKYFQMPWNGFAADAKNKLEKTIISFKQNIRIINKTNNKFWSYKDENGHLNIGKDGKPKKKLRKQTKGDNWAIRKALHKETVSGLYNIDTPKAKIATSVRTLLSEIKNEKHLNKITDKRIREVILPNHLEKYLNENGEPRYDIAFSQEGVEDLNKNIVALNQGKKHQPIFKVKMYEVGSKFSISEEQVSLKNKKYVEAAKGTNLFFAIYWDQENQKRNYDTVPLNEVIAHQKSVAKLPKEERTTIQAKAEKGKLLFTLSPNDLVYIPTEEEMENPHIVDFNNLNKEQVRKIYKMVSTTKGECHFVPNTTATEIKKNENGTNSKNERIQILNNEVNIIDKKDNSKGVMIKERCWKLKVDRLGNIIDVKKG
jgi:CRISPR-associated endonuclease Csn1